MTLKTKISGADFESLNSEIQAHYEKNEGGAYILKTEGDESFNAIKSEKAKIKQELDDLKARIEAETAQKVREAEERALKKAQAEYEKARSENNIEALEKSWQEKNGKLENELKALQNVNDELRNEFKVYREREVVGDVVKKLVSKYAHTNCEQLLEMVLSQRIKAHWKEDGNVEARVCNKDGEIVADTIDELMADMHKDQNYSSILKANAPLAKGEEKHNALGDVGGGKKTHYAYGYELKI